MFKVFFYEAENKDVEVDCSMHNFSKFLRDTSKYASVHTYVDSTAYMKHSRKSKIVE